MQTTIYIRKENEEYWNSLADKSLQVNHWIVVARDGASTTETPVDPPTPKVAEESQDGPDDYKPTPAIVRELERLKKA